jgi:hypothetical protein
MDLKVRRARAARAGSLARRLATASQRRRARPVQRRGCAHVVQRNRRASDLARAGGATARAPRRVERAQRRLQDRPFHRRRRVDPCRTPQTKLRNAGHWAGNSVGRVLALHAGCHRFKPGPAYYKTSLIRVFVGTQRPNGLPSCGPAQAVPVCIPTPSTRRDGRAQVLSDAQSSECDGAGWYEVMRLLGFASGEVGPTSSNYRFAARAATGDRRRLCGQFLVGLHLIRRSRSGLPRLLARLVPSRRLSCLAHARAWRAALCAHRRSAGFRLCERD